MKKLGLNGTIITTDLQKSAPASFIADYSEQVPSVTDPNYIDALLRICSNYEVELLIPLIDPELYLLSQHIQAFAETGAKVLVSSPEVNQICIDKRDTYHFFKAHQIPTPRLFKLDDVAQTDQIFPLIVKPAKGSCSVGVHKVNTLNELQFFSTYIQDSIIQENIEGEEYTLDILVDFQGAVKVVVPRLRLATRAGEISKGITVKNPDLIMAGKKVAESLPGAIGCLTVQCFLTTDNLIKFIEINPRFGGGFPLSYQAGADFPSWLIAMAQGKEIHISIDEWQDKIAMMRYDDAIFTTEKII